MATDFDFISATDKPALVAISNPEVFSFVRGALVDLGYKVHNIEAHEEFVTRFAEVQYQLFVIEETFGGTEHNTTLALLQTMPMISRRHATVVLIGQSFETLNAMQAFQQSVHAVVNYSELNLIPQLVQKVAADNTLFLNTFREATKRVAQTRFEPAS